MLFDMLLFVDILLFVVMFEVEFAMAFDAWLTAFAAVLTAV